jgi:hypothetical protein
VNATIDAFARKVFIRAELTKRLVSRLGRSEAAIGGIGNTNFDLYAAGHRPQRRCRHQREPLAAR